MYRIASTVICLLILMSPCSALRVYFIGNSFTDCLNYAGFQNMVESQGLVATWGRTMIPGAPLSWFWTHPNDGISEQPYGIWSTAFTEYEWDAVSLNICSRTLANSDGDPASINHFCSYTAPKSPNVQMYAYQTWPNKSMGDYTTVWNAKYTGSGNTYCSESYYDTLMKVVRMENASVLNKPILMIPAGQVLFEIEQRCKSGTIPGLSSVYDLYSDDGHLNKVGGYVLCCTFFSVMYQKDPRGLPVPSDYGSIPTDVAAAIQDAVWSVVKSSLYTGLGNVPVTFSKNVTRVSNLKNRTDAARYQLLNGQNVNVKSKNNATVPIVSRITSDKSITFSK